VVWLTEEGKAYDFKHRLLEYFERKRKQVPITHGALHNQSSIDPIPEAAYIGDPTYVFDFLDHYNVIRAPTNGGWNTSNVGSGNVAISIFFISPRSGTTANSQALAYVNTFGLNLTVNGYYIDWQKLLVLQFIVSRQNSDPEAVARFQLKESYSQGALTQRGVGVEISNYAMIGESYGTSRGTVNLITLEDVKAYVVKIVKKADRVEFWVNGVLVGSITNTAYIPSVQGNTSGFLVASIVNGSTGGVDARFWVGNIIIVQEV